MILKKFKRGNFQKTKAAMIGGLVDYVLAHKDEEGNRKRLYAFGMNFLTGTTEAWKREMIALAEESTRSRMPVAHWAMSWQENEMPDYEQVLEAVNIFLERMGLKEHQTLVAAHVNTGNFHIHIVVNRTHPYTEKVIQPHRGFDIEAAHRIVTEIEHKQGWASQEHARYRVNEKGEIVRNRLPKQVKLCSRAEDFENATGEKSAQRIAQEKGHSVIQNASCWEELHAGLDAVGLRFVRKGSGAVIFVGDTAIKASSVDRNFGMSKLCKRLGEFKPGFYSEQTFRKTCMPGGMAGVSEGAAKTGGRESLLQKETGGRAARTETTSAGTPGDGYRPSCFTRAFHTEHCPALSERTGTGGKSGVAGQASSIRKNEAAPALQALARQAKSAPG